MFTFYLIWTCLYGDYVHIADIDHQSVTWILSTASHRALFTLYPIFYSIILTIIIHLCHFQNAGLPFYMKGEVHPDMKLVLIKAKMRGTGQWKFTQILIKNKKDVNFWSCSTYIKRKLVTPWRIYLCSKKQMKMKNSEICFFPRDNFQSYVHPKYNLLQKSFYM